MLWSYYEGFGHSEENHGMDKVVRQAIFSTQEYKLSEGKQRK